MGCQKLTYQYNTTAENFSFLSQTPLAKSSESKNLYVKVNHLGNVLAVVSDRKIPEFDGSNNLTHYTADVVSFADYFPFGSYLPNRHGGQSLRHSFQGQEQDPEIKGEGNSINYTYRMHDPRVGRFFTLDPLAPAYPHNSPYAFSENRVIDKIELEGLEAWEPKNAKVDVMSLNDFSSTVKKDIIPLAKQSHSELQFDCNDLALFTVMKYFEIKEVEFTVTVGKRTYSSSDEKYKNFNQFFEVVRGQVSSSIAKANLSVEITPDQVVAGDMYVGDYHTYVLLGSNEGDASNQQNAVYGSGYYYGKNHPDTYVNQELTEGNFRITQSGDYKIARWSAISDLVRDFPVITMTPKQVSSLPTTEAPAPSAGPQIGPRQEDGSF
jgi:RHS repeat-associated protein